MLTITQTLISVLICIVDGFVFRMETVNTFYSKRILDEYEIEIRGHMHFPRMDDENRRRLCFAVKEYAALDESLSMNNPKLKHQFYLMKESSTSMTSPPLMQCLTIPITYVRIDQSSNPDEYTIIMERNKYIDFHRFDLERVHTAPMSCSEVLASIPAYVDMDAKEFEDLRRSKCHKDWTVATSGLNKLTEDDRLHLCFAAKKCYEHVRPHVILVLNNHRVEPPEIFEIDLPNQVKKTRVVVSCPSFPHRLYVYFKNLRLNNDIEVLVYETNESDRDKSSSDGED